MNEARRLSVAAPSLWPSEPKSNTNARDRGRDRACGWPTKHCLVQARPPGAVMCAKCVQETSASFSAGDGLDQQQAIFLVDYWVLIRFEHRLVEHDAQCRGGFPGQVTRSARVSHGQRLQQLAKGETSLRELELESPESQRSADRPPQLDPQAASL